MQDTARQDGVPDNPQTAMQSIFNTVIDIYVQNYVQTQPPANEGCARPQVACRCSDCSNLNRFLASATQQVLPHQRNEEGTTTFSQRTRLLQG